jgi:hypothetical protein
MSRLAKKIIAPFIKRISMSTETILENSFNSILISEERERKDVVIAVPHHAPLGVAELPCKEHKDADENAGFLGYYTARLLNCHFVIACNYFIDPNKTRETDYFKILKHWKPKYVIEIHGHGSNSARYDIEISSGKPDRSELSENLANRLKGEIAKTNYLKDYSISGEFSSIYFKATKSASISTDEWIPFHIELPKSIRSEKSKYLLFCEILAKSMSNLIDEFDKKAKL